MNVDADGKHSEQSVKSRMKAHFARMKKNFAAVRQVLSRRKVREERLHVPLTTGFRPQDVLAVFLLTVGAAIVLLDIPTFPWLQSLPHAYREGFSFVTDFGKAHWILWSTGLFCIGMTLLDWERLTFRVKMSLITAWTYCAFIFVTVAGSGVLVLIFKWIIGRARPKFYEELGPVYFDVLGFNGSFTSFPSGHSTTVAAMATALALIFPTWLWLIVVCAFWLAFSRIMVGAHYPSDVVAGTLLGVTFTMICARWLARRGVGFKMSGGNWPKPLISPFSAKICARSVWRLFRGRLALYKAVTTERDPSDLPSEMAP